MENQIIELVGLLVTFLIATFAAVGKVTKKIEGVSKELKEFLAAIAEALAPDADGNVRLTGDEIRRIIDEADDIPGAIRDALRKKK